MRPQAWRWVSSVGIVLAFVGLLGLAAAGVVAVLGYDPTSRTIGRLTLIPLWWGGLLWWAATRALDRDLFDARERDLERGRKGDR